MPNGVCHKYLCIYMGKHLTVNSVVTKCCDLAISVSKRSNNIIFSVMICSRLKILLEIYRNRKIICMYNVFHGVEVSRDSIKIKFSYKI